MAPRSPDHTKKVYAESRMSSDYIVEKTCVDGNWAVAHAAYRMNDVAYIFPITPSSPMGENVDAWAEQHKKNLWGQELKVIEMQSEGGAAGALHGALVSGSLATTFTASQGLLLYIPNLYKIAGELLPTVIHVASRALAGQALSIYGDHSDTMLVRGCGLAMLSSFSVQEAHDMAVISQVASLISRVPFLHFMDGFRTSHEIDKITLVSDDQLRALMPWDKVDEHRQRALSPLHPRYVHVTQMALHEWPPYFFTIIVTDSHFFELLCLLLYSTANVVQLRILMYLCRWLRAATHTTKPSVVLSNKLSKTFGG